MKKGNVRRVRALGGSLILTLVPGLARDKGILVGTRLEQRSLPLTVQGLKQLAKEHPDALVVIPIKEDVET